MKLHCARGGEPELALGFGRQFDQLYQRAGLEAIDSIFLQFVKGADAELYRRLADARTRGASYERKLHSDLIVDLAPNLENFLGVLFGIEESVRRLQWRDSELAPLHVVKRSFVQRRATKNKTAAEASQIDGVAVAKDLAALFGEPFSELAYARHVLRWMEAEQDNGAALTLAARYALWATLSAAGRQKHGDGILFKLPRKIDRLNFIPLQRTTRNGMTVLKGLDDTRRYRDGFKLTDQGASFAQALDHANYCIWCHNQGKDSCSKGLRDRKTGAYEVDVFGTKQVGCPLEERISEMNLARSRGYVVAALAIVAIDNPLCAATGHRICNDCMKACIYQKQEPVDIPQVETQTLKDVLALPWGFEIY